MQLSTKNNQITLFWGKNIFKHLCENCMNFFIQINIKTTLQMDLNKFINENNSIFYCSGISVIFQSLYFEKEPLKLKFSMSILYETIV